MDQQQQHPIEIGSVWVMVTHEEEFPVRVEGYFPEHDSIRGVRQCVEYRGVNNPDAHHVFSEDDFRDLFEPESNYGR